MVKFYSDVDDNKLRFAVIAAKYKGKWVLCKHKNWNTFSLD